MERYLLNRQKAHPWRPLVRPVRVTKRPKKKDKERNLTVANCVYAQTTHVIGWKRNVAWWVAVGVYISFTIPYNTWYTLWHKQHNTKILQNVNQNEFINYFFHLIFPNLLLHCYNSAFVTLCDASFFNISLYIAVPVYHIPACNTRCLAAI